MCVAPLRGVATLERTLAGDLRGRTRHGAASPGRDTNTGQRYRARNVRELGRHGEIPASLIPHRAQGCA